MALMRLCKASFVAPCLALAVAGNSKANDATADITMTEPVNTLSEHLQPAALKDGYGFLEDDCPGCRSEEREADSEIWELFNSSGEALRQQAEREVQAMGWNGQFEEFVPMRYAEQSVSGQRFFVRVRVDPHGVFIDALIFCGLKSSLGDGEPVLEGIRVGKDESDPIDDFKVPPSVQAGPACRGCRSEEQMADSEIWELFNASGEALRQQAEREVQAMGWNGVFEEFVPVRYAKQVVSGKRYFVRVQVNPHGVFIDVLISTGVPPSNGPPTLEGVRVGKDEKDPIDDFESPESLRAVEVVV